MKLVLSIAVSIVVLLPVSLVGQIKVAVETDLSSASFKATHQFFEAMCMSFAMKLAEVPASGMIRFKPKYLLPSKGATHKGVWVILYGNREVPIDSAKLPDALYDLSRDEVKMIKDVICYTGNRLQYTVYDITVTTVSPEAAQELSQVMSK